MTFRRPARLDPRQVRDLRGVRTTRPGIALAGGGGLVSLVVIVLFIALGGDIGSLVGGSGGYPSVIQGDVSGPGSDISTCQSGSDANERDDCRIVGYVNSIQAYWIEEFDVSELAYDEALTTLFTDAVETACGYATTATGPFYCPIDTSVYLDLSFFRDMRTRLGATGGHLATAYVVAHEYGHHVQQQLGLLGRQSRATGPTSKSVKTELQADCLAGVWVSHAADTDYLLPPTQDELASALDAAAAVGDDRIQRRTTGTVDPDSWTHGSSAQRQDWFSVGYRSGDFDSCDTSRV